MQVLSDLSQLPVYVTSDNDASARGACVQAAAAAKGRKISDVCGDWRPRMVLGAEPSVPKDYSNRRRQLYREQARLAYEMTSRH